MSSLVDLRALEVAPQELRGKGPTVLDLAEVSGAQVRLVSKLDWRAEELKCCFERIEHGLSGDHR